MTKTKRPPHIALDEAAFSELVAGKTIELEDRLSHEKVRLILSDIGFARMYRAIDRAEAAQRARRADR
jgi:hypothetical protein